MLPVEDRPGRSVRIGLILIALGLIAVFSIALCLRPNPRGFGTHETLGLPPCTFLAITKYPCPSCGMTTSFSHLVRGDWWEAWAANPVGLLLALCCLVAIPYCLVCGFWGRRLGITDYEFFLSRAMIVFMIVLIGAWIIRLAIHWLLKF